jgi:hypothetical protein
LLLLTLYPDELLRITIAVAKEIETVLPLAGTAQAFHARITQCLLEKYDGLALEVGVVLRNTNVGRRVN